MARQGKRCPLCKAVVETDAAKCFACGAEFIDGGNEVRITGLSKDELSARMSETREKINSFKLPQRLYTLGIFSVIAAFFVLIGMTDGDLFGFPLLIPFLALVSLIFFIMKAAGCSLYRERHKRTMVFLLKENIGREVLAQTFELDSYKPKDCIAAEVIKETNLITGWNEWGGSDFVQAKYKGVPIVFSDITLTCEYERRTKKGGKVKRSRTMFSGQWIEISLARPVSAAVYLDERTDLFGTRRPDIKTEEVMTTSDAFNKKYRVLAQDPAMAFNILTPHFMERITAADNAADSHTHFCFMGDRVRIAMQSDRNSFEIRELKEGMNADVYRSKVKADLQYITGVVDELLKNEFLFGRS